MKKAILLFFLFIPMFLHAQSTAIVGDMNNDGKLTIEDITLLTETILGNKAQQTITIVPIVTSVKIGDGNITESDLDVELTANVTTYPAGEPFGYQWVTRDTEDGAVSNINGATSQKFTPTLENINFGDNAYLYVSCGAKLDSESETEYKYSSPVKITKPVETVYYYGLGDKNIITNYVNNGVFTLPEGAGTYTRSTTSKTFTVHPTFRVMRQSCRA